LVVQTWNVLVVVASPNVPDLIHVYVLVTRAAVSVVHSLSISSKISVVYSSTQLVFALAPVTVDLGIVIAVVADEIPMLYFRSVWFSASVKVLFSQACETVTVNSTSCAISAYAWATGS